MWTPALWSSEFERSIWGTFSMFHFLFRISVEEFEFYNHFSWYQEFNKTLEVFKAKPKKLCILKFWFFCTFSRWVLNKTSLMTVTPFSKENLLSFLEHDLWYKHHFRCWSKHLIYNPWKIYLECIKIEFQGEEVTFKDPFWHVAIIKVKVGGKLIKL